MLDQHSLTDEYQALVSQNAPATTAAPTPTAYSQPAMPLTKIPLKIVTNIIPAETPANLSKLGGKIVVLNSATPQNKKAQDIYNNKPIDLPDSKTLTFVQQCFYPKQSLRDFQGDFTGYIVPLLSTEIANIASANKEPFFVGLGQGQADEEKAKFVFENLKLDQAQALLDGLFLNQCSAFPIFLSCLVGIELLSDQAKKGALTERLVCCVKAQNLISEYSKQGYEFLHYLLGTQSQKEKAATSFRNAYIHLAIGSSKMANTDQFLSSLWDQSPYCFSSFDMHSLPSKGQQILRYWAIARFHPDILKMVNSTRFGDIEENKAVVVCLKPKETIFLN